VLSQKKLFAIKSGNAKPICKYCFPDLIFTLEYYISLCLQNNTLGRESLFERTCHNSIKEKTKTSAHIKTTITPKLEALLKRKENCFGILLMLFCHHKTLEKLAFVCKLLNHFRQRGF
jgi:hypothetical protein